MPRVPHDELEMGMCRLNHQKQTLPRRGERGGGIRHSGSGSQFLFFLIKNLIKNFY